MTCPAAETMTLHVPFRIVRRGWRKVIALPDGAQAPRRPDDALVKALARAFRWKRMLERRRLRHHRRACRARGHRALLPHTRHAPDAARTRHGGGDPRQQAGTWGDLGPADERVPGGVGEPAEVFLTFSALPVQCSS